MILTANYSELTPPILAKASFSISTTSLPTAPLAVKSLVQRLRVPSVRLVWLTGNENVKPRGSLFVMLCFLTKSAKALAMKSKRTFWVDCIVSSSSFILTSSCSTLPPCNSEGGFVGGESNHYLDEPFYQKYVHT